MDTKKLAVLIDALKLGSFSKAAEKHGYTAPALIYIADGIENELGIKLICRSSFGIRPTKEGELLLPRLTELCRLEESIKKEAQSLSRSKRKVTIGCYSSVAKSFLVNKLYDIRQKLSEIEIAIVIKDSIGEMRELGAEIFLVNKEECRGREFVSLYTAEYVAVVNPIWFKNNESISAEELCKHPFIMPCESAVAKVFSSLEPEIMAVNSDDDRAIIEMVKRGIGNTVLTSRSVGKSESGVRILPLTPKLVSEIVLTYGKGSRDVERVAKAILNN